MQEELEDPDLVDLAFSDSDNESEHEPTVGWHGYDDHTYTSPLVSALGFTVECEASVPESSDQAQAPASRFYPPTAWDTLAELYAPKVGLNASISALRFVRRGDPRELLIFTDGACLDNGFESARAGCGFVFRPAASGSSSPANAIRSAFSVPGDHYFRLETYGPTGVQFKQTSNRAELRAVIAAIAFRAWSGERFRRLVIATHSSYVVEGATNWVKGWRRRGWRTSRNRAVASKDLWVQLIETIAKRRGDGLAVSFWLIPREWNTEAGRCAGTGARMEAADPYCTTHGVEC